MKPTANVPSAIPSSRLRVSVVKHAHHQFDIDQPGKDTYRHRAAGAFEVVVASNQRLALMREFERPAELTVHQLIAELHEGVDWVLVEGFKSSDLLKIEVWRAGVSKSDAAPVLYVNDDFVVAIATDTPDQLPQATLRPVLDINNAEAVADYLLTNHARFEYSFDMH